MAFGIAKNRELNWALSARNLMPSALGCFQPGTFHPGEFTPKDPIKSDRPRKASSEQTDFNLSFDVTSDRISRRKRAERAGDSRNDACK
jgi:hypothetical protein